MRVWALPRLPEVGPGDDIAGMLAERARAGGVVPGDVVCVAHKVVSKAEGRVAVLDDVRPGGLGVHIIHSCMDTIEFQHPPEGGTRLRMVKRLDKGGPQGPTPPPSSNAGPGGAAGPGGGPNARK